MKKYLEALQLFISNDKKYRPELCTIFSCNGIAIATDGYAMAYVCESILAAAPERYEGKIDFLKVMPKYDANTFLASSYSKISMVLDKLEKVEETICTNNDECDECNGNGTVEWEYTSHFSAHTYEREDECPKCNGSGIKGVTKKTGRLVCGEYEKLKIANKVFYAWQIERLLKCMDLLGETNLKLYYLLDDKQSMLFGIGELKIVVMPAYSTPEQLKKYHELEFTGTIQKVP